ncbi:hypothetical protein AJ78_01184 [Emergomyces pasteurianus Ep9510]|uniref:Trafficking protein particle complex II-specific subunit 65 IgD3 domain-containing protein n=1 Tax=Emergomyces pasteurianus Ep9510 TaxID=1447872 RepID=A0A1J9QF90_9EURO|nr:hypothetical protein AJ78_01184 [Emergomyces pasteurianus Ep9510]
MAPEEFLRRAVLDTIIPYATQVNLEDALNSSIQEDIEDSPSLLPTIRQRSLLFFDELLPVYVALRLTNCSEHALKTHLPRLTVLLEAYAVNGAAGDDGEDESPQQPARDLIFSGTVSDDEDPLVVVNEVDDEEDVVNHVYVIWKLDTFLNRPRVRLQHPSVVFSASATLSPVNKESEESEDAYLPTGVPGSVNIFQSLVENTSQGQSNPPPFLPASRLLRVVPVAREEESSHRVQQETQQPLRIIPIASARIRYSRLNPTSRKPTTIANLDFEVTPYTNFDVILQKTELTLFGGQVESLTNSNGYSLPVTCRPRDDMTFVYKLTPEHGMEAASSTTATVYVLDISLGATICVSEECRPRISMQWRTNVDFSLLLNPSFSGPSQVLQQNNRPASLPITPSQSGGGDGGGTPTSLTTNGGALATNRRSAYVSTADIGVTISFSGPSSVEVGKPFHWDVFIVNRSQKPKKFAMAAVPRRKRADARSSRHITRPSSSSVSSGRKDEQIAEAVTDENIVYAMQKNAIPYDTELICLSTDIRVGPLLPGTCHSTELKLLPLSAGVLHVEAVRLVDLNTNEATDIRDLPDIISFERQAEQILPPNLNQPFSLRLPTTSTTTTSEPHLISSSAVFSFRPRHLDSVVHPSTSTRTYRALPTFPTAMFDTTKKKVLDGLNSRYIYGRMPLLHTIIFLLEMAVTMRLAAKFNSYYAERPVLTTMVTNSVLGGIADTVAQTITAVRTRMAARRRSRSSSNNDLNNDLISIEIYNLDKEKPPTVGELGSYYNNSKHLAPPFDFERLTRFMAYGFFMAPIQFQWFGFLARSFPITKTHATLPALKRVAMDQLIFAPVGLVCFFTFMTVAEGGGRRAVVRKLQDVYTPTLRANFMLWPAVQIINFRVVPIQFQIPFVSTVGIAWTAYLSLANSSEEE